MHPGTVMKACTGMRWPIPEREYHQESIFIGLLSAQKRAGKFQVGN